MKNHFIALFFALTLTACQQINVPPVPVKTTEQATAPSADPSNIVPINAMANSKLEVAITAEQQEIGLMNRPSMAANAGMVFIFDEPSSVCFWMKNTLIPLSIGFIDTQGVLVQIEDMAPNTLNTHCAKIPVKYAVEMNQGWFTKNHANIGMPLLQTKTQ